MGRLKEHFFITLIISILLGIFLPLVMGLDNPSVIAISFIFVFCISSILLFVMLSFVEGIRSRQEWKARKKSLPESSAKLMQEWEAFYEAMTRGSEKKNNQSSVISDQ
jgi:Na+/H+-dicarboxylate symporter